MMSTGVRLTTVYTAKSREIKRKQAVTVLPVFFIIDLDNNRPIHCKTLL